VSDQPGMTYISDAASLATIADESTVSRTILKGEGVNVVLFSFDAGQELSEHTAAMPVLLQTLVGSLEVSADGQTVTLAPGDFLHLRTRVPHSVRATERSQLLLTMVKAARS
jgi:quercetin dioxygenase-like cupin family protein